MGGKADAYPPPQSSPTRGEELDSDPLPKGQAVVRGLSQSMSNVLLRQIFKVPLDLPFELGRAAPFQRLHDLLAELLGRLLFVLPGDLEIAGVNPHASLLPLGAVREGLRIEREGIAGPA